MIDRAHDLPIAKQAKVLRISRGSVYFASLADIIGALAKAEREGQLRERIRFLCRSSLLIVDEIGYLPVIPGGGNLFFQLVNARYERGAIILTSNRGFAEWGEVFGEPTVCDVNPSAAAVPCTKLPSGQRAGLGATPLILTVGIPQRVVSGAVAPRS